MSITEVYEQRGMAALLRLVAVILTFALLQALRLLPQLLDQLLAVAQQRLDQVVVAGLPAQPAGDGGVSP